MAQTENSVVIFNRLCAGNYLNEGENLGHEIIHFFEAEETIDGKREKSNYIYLLSDGTYPYSRKNQKIDSIYYTKGINEGCVEVIAVVDGKEIEPIFDPQKGFSLFEGGLGIYDDSQNEREPIWKKLTKEEKEDKDIKSKAISEVCYLFEKLLSKDTLASLTESYPQLKSEINTNIEWLDTHSFVMMKIEDRDKRLLDAACPISHELLAISEKLPKSGWMHLKKAIVRRAEHIKQLEYIVRRNITFGGVRIDKLFSDNTSYKYGLAIYLTYKVSLGAVKKPKTPIFIINNVKNKKDIDTAEYIVVNNKKLAGQKLATYFEDNEIGKDSFEKLQYEKVKKYLGSESPYRKFVPSVKIDSISFLSIIRKEYDELAFSNLFAYFFKHASYKNIIIDLLKNKSKNAINNDCELNLDDNFELYRETEKNIDILLVDKENVVVIENKIHSGINGLEFDSEGNVIGTQLNKYRKFVTEEDPVYSKKHPYFFVFAPNYTHISKEELEGYVLITYKDLLDAYKKAINYMVDTRTEIYFKDFLLGLEIHSNNVSSQHEQIMHRRLQEVITKYIQNSSL